MLDLSTILSVSSLLVSLITIVKVVIGVNTTLTRLTMSIDTLTKSIDEEIKERKIQGKEIESIKLSLVREGIKID